MIWTRAELKANAKKVLRKTYFTALVVSVVIAIVGMSVSNGNSGSNNGSNNDYYSDHYYGYDYGYGYGNDHVVANSVSSQLANIFAFGLAGIFSVVFLIIVTFRIFIKIFAGYAIEVGGRKYFIETGEGKEFSLQNLAYGFRNSYKNITITMFKRGLYNALWYFALIVPGIIKTYAWRFVPYILADNPDMDSSAALKLSEDMTMGHKMNIFVLDLSFFGWRLLGSLIPFGIGQYFVMPYTEATDAQLYLRLRQDAIDRGAATSIDFRLA